MKDFIHYLVSKIVNFPEEIEIEETLDDSRGRSFKVYNIKVNPEDIRLLIGKEGKTIQSIRNVAKVKAVKDQEFIDVRITETNPDFAQQNQ